MNVLYTHFRLTPFSDTQALGGGYIHWGHIEMMRLTINRKMDSRTTFARWRINSPYKPVTRKGLGQRMGGGKGAIDHYVTPIRYGRLIVEVGGKVELGEVEHILTEVAKKLPFPAKVRLQNMNIRLLSLITSLSMPYLLKDFKSINFN